jgi:hypothetical protein
MNSFKEAPMPKKISPVEAEIEQLYRAHYRLAASGWVGGDTEITVTLSDEPSAIAESTKVWHKKHTWSGTNLEVRLTASPKWKRAVRDRGLAVLDGLLTTHAGRVQRDQGIEVYPATWIRHSLGLSVRPESGWIAIHCESGTTYHLVGGNPKQAVARLRRKLKTQAIPEHVKDERRRHRVEARRAEFDRLVQRLASHDLSGMNHVLVTRQDSLQAGNCEPGTDEFAARFFPNRTSAMITEIVEAFGVVDLTRLDEGRLKLARQIAAACLVALRRAKREHRARH